jgi:leucyl aminopeptidase
MMILTALLMASCPQAEAAPVERQLLAIRGPLAPGQEQALVRLVDFYGDFGRIAVAEGDLGQREKLAALGFEFESLGSWPKSARLVVLGAEQATGFRSVRLFEHAGQELRAVPLAEALRHGHLLTGCHAHAIAPVERRAALPTRFEAPPIGPGGVLLGSALQPAAAGRSGAAATALTTSADPRIAALIGQVSGANIQATVAQLASYTTRRSTSPQLLQAQAWLESRLATIPGLVVTKHTWDGAHAPNLIAELPGSDPDRVVVLGAHLDSINLSGSTLPAPGADDNASGSGGLLELARVLAAVDFESTLRFVWFSGEEFGLLGADAYAKKLLADGDQPLAMLNMDMIAHRAVGDALDLDLATNNTDPGLTQFVKAVAETYVPSLPVVLGVLTAGSSDHAAFQANGIPAAFLFEDLTSFSPVIHTSGDVLGPTSANDFVLAERIARVCLATAAEIAEPLDLSLAHTPLADSSDASGPYPLSVAVSSLTGSSVAAVEVRWRVGGGPWQSRDLSRSGAGPWVGSLPAAGSPAEFEYYLLASDANGYPEWLPEGLTPGAKTLRFSVGSFTPAFVDGFETPTDNGWTHVQIATQDDWQRGLPAGKGGDPKQAFAGTRVWGNDLGPSGFNGLYQPNVENRLESPAINLLGKSNVHLRYRRWLTVEDGAFDRARILVDGVQVWQNPVGGGDDHFIDAAWVLHDLDISSLADGDPSLRLRFELRSDGGLEFGGWNLDDVSLVEVGPGSTKNFAADALHLSTGQGAAIGLTLDGGLALAGRPYLIAGGLSGAAPGISLDGTAIPLAPDAVTSALLGLVNTPVAPGWLGQLSPQGRAQAGLNLGPLAPSLVGQRLRLLWFTLAPTQFVSQPLEFEFVF